jgi:anti-sigma-K factor RskA
MNDRDLIGADDRQLDDDALVALAEMHATPPPPPLRERVLAEARREVTVKKLGRALFRYRMIGAVAAGAALALGGLLGREARLTTSQGIELATLRQANSRLATELDAHRRVLVGLRERLDAQAQVLRVVGGQARGRVLVDAASGEAAIFVSGLSPAPKGKTYELWSIRGNQAPEPAGLFAVADTDAVATRVARIERAQEVTAFAVSVEPTGGSQSPTGPIVLVGAVS